MLYKILERTKTIKIQEKVIFENQSYFYDTIIKDLFMIITEKDEDENDQKRKVKMIIGTIKLIISDDQNIFKYLDNIKKEKKDKFKNLIKQIIDILTKRIIKSNGNLKNSEEYLNSLIILLESLGEHKNEYFLDYIFEKDGKQPEAKSVFDRLIDIYKYILLEFKDENGNREYNEEEKNKLILLNSLTNCIIEYIELSNFEKDKKDSIKSISKNNIISDDNINNSKNIENDDGKNPEINNSTNKKEDKDIDEFIKIKWKEIEIKDDNDNDINKKKNLIYNIFILENHLQIIIHLVKMLQIGESKINNKLSYLSEKFKINNSNKDNKLLFLQTLNIMNICFKSFLVLQKTIELTSSKISNMDNKVIYNFDNNDENDNDIDVEDKKEKIIFAIEKDAKDLFKKYKRTDVNEFITLEQGGSNELVKYEIKKELLVLIYLNYQQIFYLTNYETLELNEFKYFLEVNDNKDNLKKIKYFVEYYFGYGQESLMVLFSFLQKIHDIIEIKLNNETFYQLNLVKPEFFGLSINSKNYFSNLIDYTSPETKLITIYNYIECIIYDIIYKKWEKDESCFIKTIRDWKVLQKLTTSTYKFWEYLNFIAFIVINCFLIYDYKKPRNEIELKFNEIDNRQSFLMTTIWPGVHIFILLIIFIYWCFSRSKIDYFYAMTKYIHTYFEEKEKLTMEQKAKLLKKSYEDFSINSFFPVRGKEKIKSFFSKGNNYLEGIKDTISYVFINYIKVFFYTFKTIFPFILSIIFLALTYWSQIFFIVPLFLLFNLSESLKLLFLLFIDQFVTLFIILIFFVVILYIFSWFAFFFLPKMYKYEAVDKNNEIINPDYIEENICSSTVPCILYFINYGFRDDLMDTNLISFKNETGYYLRQFFFNIFIYIFIHLIFDNIFLVTISNAFDEMKKNMLEKEDKEENVCFICEKTKNDCIEKYEDFQEHLEKHNMWKYIRYICNIILKNKNQFNDMEYYVWNQIKYKKLDWYPYYSDEEN